MIAERRSRRQPRGPFGRRLRTWRSARAMRSVLEFLMSAYGVNDDPSPARTTPDPAGKGRP